MSEIKKPKFVAIDDGYANTKMAYPSKNETKVWSEPTHITSGAKMTTGFNGESDANIYITEDMPYTVGYVLEQMDTRFDDYPFSPANRVMVHHALRNAGLENGDSVNVAVSVPLAQFFNPNTRETIIKKRKESLSKPVIEMNEEGEGVKIEGVTVLPEAASAYIDLIIGDNGEDLTNGGTSMPIVAIIDIGGRTTDIAVMMGADKIDMPSSGTEDIGVLDLLSRTSEAIGSLVTRKNNLATTANIPLRTAEIALHGLSSNMKRKNKTPVVIKVHGKNEDVTSILEEQVSMFVNDVHNLVQRKIQNIAPQLDEIILIGGGAALIGDAFKNVHPSIVVPEEPHFANVRGMYKLMKYIKGF